jgi:hypothetical protein
VTSHRVTFEGPADLAIGIATALADADGVDLTASDPIAKVDDHTVRLAMTAEGSIDAVADAIAALRADLPSGATITMAGAG